MCICSCNGITAQLHPHDRSDGQSPLCGHAVVVNQGQGQGEIRRHLRYRDRVPGPGLESSDHAASRISLSPTVSDHANQQGNETKYKSQSHKSKQHSKYYRYN